MRCGARLRPAIDTHLVNDGLNVKFYHRWIDAAIKFRCTLRVSIPIPDQKILQVGSRQRIVPGGQGTLTCMVKISINLWFIPP